MKPTIRERLQAAAKSLVQPNWHTGLGSNGFWPNWPDQRGFVSLQGSSLAERSSLVMAVINFAMTVLAEAPLQVNQETDPGEYEPVEDHPLVALWNNPNPYHSTEEIISGIARDYLLSGNVYLYQARSENARVTEELWWMPAERVDVQHTSEAFISGYTFSAGESPDRMNQVRMDIPADRMIHLRYKLNPADTRLGIGPFSAVWDEIAADEAASSYSKTVMVNVGVPPYAVGPKPNPDHTYKFDAAKLKDMLVRSTQGASAGQPVVFLSPMDVYTFGWSPQQMDVTSLRRLPETRIASQIGIPPIVLQYLVGLEHATYSNYREALKQAYGSFVIPTWRKIAGSLYRHLLPEFNPVTRRLSVDFDLRQVAALKRDDNELAQSVALQYEKGLITLNEARSILGLKPLPDGDAVKQPAPAPFAFRQAVRHLAEVKQFPELWDDGAIDAYFRELAPAEYADLLRAKVAS